MGSVKTFLHNRIIVNAAMSIIGVIGGALVELAVQLDGSTDPRWHLLAAILPLVGGLMKNPAFLNKLFGITAALLLLLAAPASADPLVHCLAGCPQAPRFDSHRFGDPIPDAVVGDTIWLGPEIGTQIFARDSATHTWESNLSFAFSYGIHWRPAWSPTASFLAFNLGLAAGTMSPTSTFDITLAPTITLMNVVSAGYGPRFHLGTTAGSADSVSGVFFFGIATALGGP